MPRSMLPEQSIHSKNAVSTSGHRPRHVVRGLAAALVAGMVPALVQVTAAHAAPVQDVNYHGYRIAVPSTWQVVDLAKNPTTCVRFDIHAVYLGHPGQAQSCPPHLVGRTEALLVEPLDRSSSARVTAQTVRPGAGRVAVTRLPNPVDHQVTVAVDRTGVLVTASYGADRAAVAHILATATLGSGATPTVTPDSQPAPAPAATASLVEPGTFSGLGFDACDAPSAAAMEAWRASSPYQAVGVYIGGISRACDVQPNLTASWVSARTSAGWHLIPTYVGLQAPCTGFSNRIDPASAASQGAASADDAVTQAQSLGIGPGSTIYEDMENYSGDAACQAAVFTFLDAWTNQLHAHGYNSGVYSSAFGAIDDLSTIYTSTSVAPPDFVWIARFNGDSTTVSDPAIPDADWADHHRIKQYMGGHQETYGGVSIGIDNDVLDVTASTPPPAFTPSRDTLSVALGDDVHLFAQGSTGILLESVFHPSTGWSGWIRHPGLTIAGRPAAVVDGEGIHLFVRGVDGHIHQTDFQPSTGWSSWASLGGDLAGDPAAVLDGDGAMHVFARATDGAILEAVHPSGQAWSSWASLGGVLVGDPAVVLDGNGALHVFARATGGAIVEAVHPSGGAWSPWASLGGVLAGDPTVILYRSTQIHLFARSTNGAIYQLRFDPDQGWSPWIKLGGVLAGDPAVIVYGADQIHLFARSTNSSIYQLRYVPGQGWLPWFNLGGVLVADPSITLSGTTINMFDFGANARVYADTYVSGPTWSGWHSWLR